MATLMWLALLVAVFETCRWSSRLLDSHYGDRAELGAVALVGLCILVPFALGADAATIIGLPFKLPLAAAIIGGLVIGHGPRALTRRRE